MYYYLGIAGVYLLQNFPQQAVGEYSKVLQLSKKYSSDTKDIILSIDKLQLIHAMYNLNDVLIRFPDVQSTFRNEHLIEDCKKVELEYVQRFEKQVQNTQIIIIFI